MIKILISCCKYNGTGTHSVGDIVDYESQFNEKSLVDGGFAEYVTEKVAKEDKTEKTSKEDKTKLQTKEAKV